MLFVEPTFLITWTVGQVQMSWNVQADELPFVIQVMIKNNIDEFHVLKVMP